MKKFFIFFLLTFPLLGYSQYQSIFGTTSTSWNVMVENTAENMWQTDSIVAGTDTVINSLEYRKISFYGLDHSSPAPPVLLNAAYVREDTALGKAWVAFWKAGTFHEYLLYDLSLQVGDNVSINGNDYPVDSVYTENGLKHVRVNFIYLQIVKYPRNTGELTFIEGIGTSFGFTYMTEELNWYPDSHINPYLLCSYKDGSQVFYHNNPEPFFSGCYHRAIIMGVETENMDPVSVYPNPVSGILTVENAGKTIPVIYNQEGKRMEVPYSNLDSTLYIDVTSLKQGMYFIRINNRFYKFIRE